LDCGSRAELNSLASDRQREPRLAPAAIVTIRERERPAMRFGDLARQHEADA
jgi:hypothetical protein